MKQYLSFVFSICISLVLLPALFELLRELGPPFSSLGDMIAAFKPVLYTLGAIGGTFSGLLLSILHYKERRAMKALDKAVIQDNIWEASGLQLQSRSVFYRVIHAWQKGDWSELQGLATDRFFEEASHWQKPPEGFDANLINSVEIDETHIVSCRDDRDDRSDSFVTYLKGNFLIPKEDNPNISELDVDKKSFSVACTFIRAGTEWQLDHVDDHITLFELLSFSSKSES